MQIASFTLSAEPPQTHSALKIEQAFNEIWAAEFRRLLFNVKVSLLITKLLLLFYGRVFVRFLPDTSLQNAAKRTSVAHNL